jgi:hypothetical protein
MDLSLCPDRYAHQPDRYVADDHLVPSDGPGDRRVDQFSASAVSLPHVEGEPVDDREDQG